jgi:hypothetical protein
VIVGRGDRGGGRKVKKTSKSDFQKNTFLEVLRCREYESEVHWLTVVGEVKETLKFYFFQ